MPVGLPFRVCGRYTHLYTWRQLHRLMNLLSPEVTLPLRYNVAPSQEAPVVVHGVDEGGSVLRPLRWGLIPSWAKDASIANALVNARGESVDSKPAFRSAFKHRRCVVPVSGFYEWQGIEGRRVKQPMYITPASGDDPWLLAGLWESWPSPQDGPVETFTIITTSPNALMAPIHDRMPVILAPGAAREWIAPQAPACWSPDRLKAFLVPYPPDGMRADPVSRVVNSPKNDTPECIQRLENKDFGSIFEQKQED